MTRKTNLITIIREIVVEQPDPDVTDISGDRTTETDEDEIIDFAKLLAEFKARASTPTEPEIAEDTTAALTEPETTEGITCDLIEPPRVAKYQIKLDFTSRHSVFSSIHKLYAKQRYKEALAFFQKRAEANPRDARSFFWLAHAQERVGDFEGYRESFKKAAELDSGFVEHMVQFLSQDAPITTFNIEGLERFLKHSKDAYAYFWLAHKHLNHTAPRYWSNQEGVRDCLQQAIELDPEFYPAYSALALSRLKSGGEEDFNFAVKSLQRIIDSDPSYTYAHLWLGVCYLWHGDMDDAKKILNENPRVLDLVDMIYQDAEMEDTLDSIKVRNLLDGLIYGSLVYQGSGEDISALRLGDSFLRQGKFEEAVSRYEQIYEWGLIRPIDKVREARIEAVHNKAKELNSGDSTACCLAGDFHFGYGRYEDAARSYERALELDSKDDKAYYGLARCYLNQKSYGTARAALKRAAKFGNKDAKAILADPPQELKPWHRKLKEAVLG